MGKIKSILRSKKSESLLNVNKIVLNVDWHADKISIKKEAIALFGAKPIKVNTSIKRKVSKRGLRKGHSRKILKKAILKFRKKDRLRSVMQAPGGKEKTLP